MTLSAAFLVYSGVMPLIKTFAALICGYVLVKLDMFPPAASRGVSIISMNIALPALIFANIVPSFTPSNASALGPLLMMGFVYQGMGFVMGVLIRELCYVPQNFWQGIIVLTGMSNWGNLPSAIVMSVTQQPPFNPALDPALGVSYVSIFSVTYHTVFWVCGAANSLAWDYLPGVPQGEDAERRVSWKEKPIGRLVARALRLPIVPTPPFVPQSNKKDEEAFPAKEDKSSPSPSSTDSSSVDTPVTNVPTIMITEEPKADSEMQLVSRLSPLSAGSTIRSRRLTIVIPPTPVRVSAAPSPLRPSVPSTPGWATAPSSPTRVAALTPSMISVIPATPTRSIPPTTPIRSVHSIHSLEDPVVISALAQSAAGPQKKRSRLRDSFFALLKPVTISLAISLPTALVLPLKALFVSCASQGCPNWHGPDNRPPLAFVMDTAQFVDTIAVPLALILLGASFARIKVPRPLSRLPIMAMLLVTLAKMVLLPVIGVVVVQAMVRGGFIPADAKAERFVAMLLSGTPSAVNQMIVSSLYAPDGNVDTLAAFLLVQCEFCKVQNALLTEIILSSS
ncbi:auxin efflux carrier [Dichomitus squalens]|uniref:Auxin efflux carrier n=1 Tax=Dichomitus squalens TaxID=114155 RepID=A0A4Q9PS38_9APHY|nr:auxin efflux carrier [Dichomitus squalens]